MPSFKILPRFLKVIRYFFMPTVLCSGTHAMAEISIIVSSNSSIMSADIKDLRALYLGERNGISGISNVMAVQANDAKSKSEFLNLVMSMAPSDLSQHWARLTFAGKGKPPHEEGDERSVLKFISRNDVAIGYVDSRIVDPSVKTLLILPSKKRNPPGE